MHFCRLSLTQGGDHNRWQWMMNWLPYPFGAVRYQPLRLFGRGGIHAEPRLFMFPLCAGHNSSPNHFIIRSAVMGATSDPPFLIGLRTAVESYGGFGMNSASLQHLSIYPFIHLSIYPFIHLSIYPALFSIDSTLSQPLSTPHVHDGLRMCSAFLQR